MELTTKKIPYESDEQIAFVAWFKQAHPGVLIWATPNGGSRQKREAMKMKLEGCLPGVPDLFIPSMRLFIEMKRQDGGTVSKDQKNVMAALRADGYMCEVCKGYKEARQLIEALRLTK